MKIIRIPNEEFVKARQMTVDEWAEWHREHGVDPRQVKRVWGDTELHEQVYEVEELLQ